MHFKMLYVITVKIKGSKYKRTVNNERSNLIMNNTKKRNEKFSLKEDIHWDPVLVIPIMYVLYD